jgi:hypothetical protein
MGLLLGNNVSERRRRRVLLYDESRTSCAQENQMLKKATELVDTRPTILQALPAALASEMSPQWCLCQRSGAELGEEQRAAHDRVHADWHLMRVHWCDAHGYLFADLLRAERR